VAVSSYKETKVYIKAFEMAMEIFELTKKFPSEEKYSLTDQIRRSSRSVCANIAEAFRKKQYPAHFVSKISDADMENSETLVWIEFSFSCGYISKETLINLTFKNSEIGKLLFHILKNPEKY
jgi:four helix bundle protein